MPQTTSTTLGPTTTEQSPPRVLVFHKTAGFRHQSIAAGVEALQEIGEEEEFVVASTENASVFTRSGLSEYDVIVFLNTTGDVLDGVQQQAMEGFISSGGGFVGVHAAADTEYDWPWYGGLVGAYFDSHPSPQNALVEVVAADHPVMRGLPRSFERHDEWYNFAEPPGPAAQVLAVLDESSYEGGNMGENHPIVWAHEYGGGRSVYTGFGHGEEVFAEGVVRTLLANAILWTAGLDGGDVD